MSENNGFSIGGGSLAGVMKGFPKLSEESLHKARVAACDRAVDADEAVYFLKMLGLVE